MPSGVGSLDNSPSHPITLRAPPTSVSRRSGRSHHQSLYNDTMAGFSRVNGEPARKKRERGRRGTLHMEGFTITVHILWVLNGHVTDFSVSASNRKKLSLQERLKWEEKEELGGKNVLTSD